MFKRFLSLTLIGAMLMTLTPLVSAQNIYGDADVDVNVNLEADMDSGEDLEDEITVSGEVSTEAEVDATAADAAEITEAVTASVSMDDFDSRDREAAVEEWTSADFSDLMHVSVQWGYFGDDKGDNTEYIDADGTVTFEGEALGFPIRLLRWEQERDELIHSETDLHATVFESTIVGYNDGILFRTKSDLDTAGDEKPMITFTNDFIESSADSRIELSLKTLSDDDDGEMVFSYDNGYKVVFHAWNRDDWINAIGARFNIPNGMAEDAEINSWYYNFMKFVIDHEFFHGYAFANGRLTGEIGPANHLTRFEAIKVASELAAELDTGVGALNCDADTVTETSTTAWMGNHWARGYVQCLENSDLDIDLLEDVIDNDLDKGQVSILRGEVVVLLFQVLDLEVHVDAESDLADLGSLEVTFRNMIETSVELGIIAGYPDGRFRPMLAVNRAEMFKIVTLFHQVLTLE